MNNPNAYIHHAYAERYLYRNSDGTLEFYDEKTHGPNVWAPEISGEEEETPTGVEAVLEASISLERDIEDFLARDLSILELGLTFVERQHDTEIGRVDILARDGLAPHTADVLGSRLLYECVCRVLRLGDDAKALRP